MEMDRETVVTKIETSGCQDMQESSARAIQEQVERDMAQADLSMVEPLKAGTPTGLFDCQGIMLREGDHVRIVNSPMLWTVRFDV